MTFPLVIVMQQDAPFLRGLQDMADMEIALVKSHASQEFLERDYPFFDYVLTVFYNFLA